MKKKLPLILLLIILLISAFLRLYRISDYMTFLGDEGRDVLVAKDILAGNLTLLGPRSSAGDFFMGPAYYYMITPFLWIFSLDPVGPAVLVALLSVATTWLVYFVGKRFFTQVAGLFAAALYAVSPLVLNYSHSSWNPNVLPFFSLLALYFTYDAIQNARSWKYFLFIGFLLGIAIQLHYLTLFLIIIVAAFLFLAQWLMQKQTFTRKLFLVTVKRYAQLLIGFVIGLSPFIAFEIRHGFPNTQSILSFIFGDTLQKTYETTMSFSSIVADVFFRIFARLLFAYPTPSRYDFYDPGTLQLWSLMIIIAAVFSIALLVHQKNKLVTLLLLLWLFLSVFLFGFYKKQIYDYLFTFLFPLPFLLFGNAFSQIYSYAPKKKKRMLWPALSVFFFSVLFVINLWGMPFRNEPNKQKKQVQTISEFVVAKADNKPFNFALLSGGNSDHAYRYYFDVLQHSPVVIENPIKDPERKTVTDQLFIVCEDIACKPLGNSLFEVAGYGRAEIVGEWDVLVVKVYKLIPYSGEEEKKSE